MREVREVAVCDIFPAVGDVFPSTAHHRYVDTIHPTGKTGHPSPPFFRLMAPKSGWPFGDFFSQI
jgi:hypothetical protein